MLERARKGLGRQVFGIFGVADAVVDIAINCGHMALIQQPKRVALGFCACNERLIALGRGFGVRVTRADAGKRVFVFKQRYYRKALAHAYFRSSFRTGMAQNTCRFV